MLAFQNHLSGVIALGKNADEPSLLHDQQRSDILLGQQGERFIDSSIRVDRPKVCPLGTQQLVYGLHKKSPLSTVCGKGSTLSCQSLCFRMLCGSIQLAEKSLPPLPDTPIIFKLTALLCNTILPESVIQGEGSAAARTPPRCCR